ncbi:MAG: GGDEF domain-containing protein [Lachnospiraceae bacterium]|nr:GGDEF domain-containing protein [Lachnospiraceae bacterium]
MKEEAKERLTIEKILHFLVHNSFMVTVVVMCLVHAALLGIMLAAGVGPLISYNILSVIVYLFCIILCKFGHIMPVYISILLEVSIFTVVAVLYIGWDCAPSCYLCSIVPIILYIGSNLFKGSKRWFLVLFLVLEFALYVALFLLFADEKPFFEVTDTIRKVLVIFSSFVMIFSMIFYTTMYIFMSEVERSSLAKKNEQLSFDAHVDVLTGLLNRRGFLPLLDELMKKKEGKSFCIAFCDIDNFKRINDSYGHDCGDEVLKHISRMIRKEMSDCDICRWGGEEIVILMKDYSFDDAKEKTEDLRKAIENAPTVFYNKRIAATITIGLEENKRSYEEPEELIRVADGRMYYGKQHGKNILIFEDMV